VALNAVTGLNNAGTLSVIKVEKEDKSTLLIIWLILTVSNQTVDFLSPNEYYLIASSSDLNVMLQVD